MVGPRMQRENKNILAAEEESAVVDQQHQKSSLLYRYLIWSDQRIRLFLCPGQNKSCIGLRLVVD